MICTLHPGYVVNIFLYRAVDWSSAVYNFFPIQWCFFTTYPGCSVQIIYCAILIQIRTVQRVHWQENYFTGLFFYSTWRRKETTERAIKANFWKSLYWSCWSSNNFRCCFLKADIKMLRFFLQKNCETFDLNGILSRIRHFEPVS